MVTSYAGATHPSVRQNNRAAIFRTLYESAPVTRVDIAARTGLSSKTVSIIMEELIGNGLVRELGQRESSGAGRKAIELEVDPSSRFAIGIDIAPPTVTAALVDLGGQVHERVADNATKATPPWDADVIVQAALRATNALSARITPDAQARIVGLGIGAPGRFKIEDGHYWGLRGAFITQWTDVGAVAHLDSTFGYPIALDNNANTTALAEQWFGAGKSVSDFVLMNMGRAIGMGIVINGDIYRGGHQSAGEAGHMVVDVNGPSCTCGAAGCLNVFASAAAVVRDVAARIEAGESSTIGDIDDLTPDDVVDAFRAGDPVAEAVIADSVRYLSAAIVTIINAYDPSLILIGRVLAAAGDRFFEMLRDEVRKQLSPSIRDTVRIEPVDVQDASVIGAATLALRRFVRAPLIRPAALATTS